MPNIEKDPDLIHEPGIYFGLSEDIYHADTALGSTDIRKLIHQPWLWQRDRIRPKNKRITEHMKWGAALHCLVLEGADEFERRYAFKPSAESFGKIGEDVLVTSDHLKDYLRERNIPISKKKKDELIVDVQGFLDHPVIYDVAIEEWLKEDRVDPDYSLTAEQLQEIRDAVWQMEQHPLLNAIMTAGSLMGGAGEVSVFYERNGMRRKNRYDYTLPPVSDEVAARAYSMICDLKSFSEFRGETSEESALHTIYRMGQDVQAVDYLDGFEAGKELLLQGKIFGEEPRENFAADLFGSEEVRWAWLMIHKDNGFIPSILHFTKDDAYREDTHFQSVERAIERAYTNYREYAAAYGLGQLWAPLSKPEPLRVTKNELPTYRRGY